MNNLFKEYVSSEFGGLNKFKKALKELKDYVSKNPNVMPRPTIDIVLRGDGYILPQRMEAGRILYDPQKNYYEIWRNKQIFEPVRLGYENVWYSRHRKVEPLIDKVAKLLEEANRILVSRGYY